MDQEPAGGLIQREVTQEIHGRENLYVIRLSASMLLLTCIPIFID